jgi:GAF domain-containing protein
MSTKERNAVLVGVADLVADLQHHALDDALLTDLTCSAAKFVPGVQFAGITVVGPNCGIDTVVATNDCVVALDDVQRMHKQGPCLAAAWENHVVQVDDLVNDARWPRYRQSALEFTFIRSVLSLPLFREAKCSGALNLYAESTHAFDDESVELALIFATHTALMWSMVRRDEQFRNALASRDIIGQAKGMLMERFNVDAQQAFDLLKRLSQTSNTPVAAIARQLVRPNRPPL